MYRVSIKVERVAAGVRRGAIHVPADHTELLVVSSTPLITEAIDRAIRVLMGARDDVTEQIARRRAAITDMDEEDEDE